MMVVTARPITTLRLVVVAPLRLVAIQHKILVEMVVLAQPIQFLGHP
jgi:hypothetical protein